MRLVVAMVVVLALTSVAFAADRVGPFRIVFRDQAVCARYRALGAAVTDTPDGCKVRLGRVRQLADGEFELTPADWLESASAPAPSRTPRPTPQPTANPNAPCLAHSPDYCWALGARLNPAGGCFASCNCVQRAPGACAE